MVSVIQDWVSGDRGWFESAVVIGLVLGVVGCRPAGVSPTTSSGPTAAGIDGAGRPVAADLDSGPLQDRDDSTAERDIAGDVEAADVAGAKLAVGDAAPDFEVEVLGGQTLRLSELIAQSQQPTILLFNRAHW